MSMKKNNLLLLFFTFLIASTFSTSLFSIEKTSYNFSNEPIDIVIPCVEKDLRTLNLCIESIKKYCKNTNRIIVVSSKPLTNTAEWFDESLFPFSKWDVSYYLNQQDTERTKAFFKTPGCKAGWYYQQLLKLYASFVIPDISSNVLIVDSDVIFLNPVNFLNENGGGLYNPGEEYHSPYFTHAKKLISGFKKINSNLSGVTHHMLFQRPVLEDLFGIVETTHNMDFWKAFCLQVDSDNLQNPGASEYEIYFNFVFSRTNQVNIRHLKWKNSNHLKNINSYRRRNYHYVAFHEYLN